MSKVGVFGVPWHGLVKDGVLDLPNGAARPHGSPAGTDVRYGDTLLVAMPWAPGAERTEDQQAADDAAGRQWENYAILGGGRFNLHGQALPNRSSSRMAWLYGDPDGTVWEVTFPRYDTRSQYANRSSISPSLNFRRFGRIPARSSATVDVWLGDHSVGQAEPAFAVNDSGWVYADLMDTTPDGSKAIIALYYEPQTVLDNPRLVCPVYPVGVWMVSISGVPGRDMTASFAVLKTRAECIGSLDVEDDYVFGPNTNFTHRAERTADDEWTHWYEESDSGYMYRPITRYALSDKVLAMWFDDSGVPQPVTLSHEFLRTENYTQSLAEQSGGPVTSRRVGGQWQDSEPIYINQLRTLTVNESLSITLNYAAQSVSWNATGSGTQTWARNSIIRHFSNSSGFDYGTTTEEASFYRQTPETEGEGQLTASELPKTARDALVAWPPPYITGSLSAYVVRYSNHALALVSTAETFTGPYRHRACITPHGIVGGEESYSPGHRFGSYNPATRQLVRGQQSPVCWT